MQQPQQQQQVPPSLLVPTTAVTTTAQGGGKIPKVLHIAQPQTVQNKLKILALGNTHTISNNINPNNHSKRSARSSERQLQTLETDSFTAYGKYQTTQATPQTQFMPQLSSHQTTPINFLHQFNTISGSSPSHNQQLQQLPNATNSSSTQNSQNGKRKLFSNLNNLANNNNNTNQQTVVKQAPTQSNFYSTISNEQSTSINGGKTSAQKQVVKINRPLATSTTSSLHLNEPAKKIRAITNENLHETITRGVIHANARMPPLVQNSNNSMETDQIGDGSTSLTTQNSQFPALSFEHAPRVAGESSVEHRSQNNSQLQVTNANSHYQQQQAPVQQQQQQQKLQLLLPLPLNTIGGSNSNSTKQSNNVFVSISDPNEKEHHHHQSGTPQINNLNAFITRVAKGEILGGNNNNNNSMNHGQISISTKNTTMKNNNNSYSTSATKNPLSTAASSTHYSAYQTLVPLGVSNQQQQQQQQQQLNQSKGFTSTSLKDKKSTRTPLKYNRFKKADKSSTSSPYNQIAGPISIEVVSATSPASTSSTQSGWTTTTNSTLKPLKQITVASTSTGSSHRPLVNSTRNASQNHANSKGIEDRKKIEFERYYNNDSEAVQKEQPSIVQQQDIGLVNDVAKPTAYYTPSMIAALKGLLVQNDSYFQQIYKEHFIQSFHSLHFCKKMKPIKKQVLQSKKVNLALHPSNQGKKTIVFDLDETLIHCNESLDIPSDVIIPIKFPNNEVVQAGINIRPYAKECLEQLSEYFEIIVFTASHGCYAVKVLEQLDPENKYISHKLFRESCVQTEEGVHVKDLRIFANRSLKDLVLVDNAAYSFALQVHNGIPIVPYYYNKADEELKHLTTYLLQNILTCQDVREINKQYFKMHLYVTEEKIEQASRKIYHV